MAELTLGGVHHARHSSGFFGRLRSRFAARAEYHRTLNELRNLDRRTLDDLGITPDQIDAVARGRIAR